LTRTLDPVIPCVSKGLIGRDFGTKEVRSFEFQPSTNTYDNTTRAAMSLFGSASSTAAAAGQTTVDIAGDLEVPQGPEDSISDLAFSPTAEILSVASWDNKIRIYEIGQGGANGKAMYEHTGPVLSTHFSKDGSKLASGSADKTAKVFDLGSGQNQQVAAHDMPIKSVKFINVNGNEALATASWDKTLKYWDLRRIFFCNMD
jgi:mRNA export factor